MHRAKKAGFDAIKFQAFKEDMIKTHPERSRLIKSSITGSNIHDINEISRKVGIEWFCTPMYPEIVDVLDPFVKRFKIRFGDSGPLLRNKTSQLIEKVLEKNKEVIVSCQESPKQTKYYNDNKIKWLYCVPKYPCGFTDLDFSNLNDFDGYSNHCPHFLAPLTAVILGAEIIEIHMTSDKSKNFADNSVSFDYAELENLANLIRISEKIKRDI